MTRTTERTRSMIAIAVGVAIRKAERLGRITVRKEGGGPLGLGLWQPGMSDGPIHGQSKGVSSQNVIDLVAGDVEDEIERQLELAYAKEAAAAEAANKPPPKRKRPSWLKVVDDTLDVAIKEAAEVVKHEPNVDPSELTVLGALLEGPNCSPSGGCPEACYDCPDYEEGFRAKLQRRGIVSPPQWKECPRCHYANGVDHTHCRKCGKAFGTEGGGDGDRGSEDVLGDNASGPERSEREGDGVPEGASKALPGAGSHEHDGSSEQRQDPSLPVRGSVHELEGAAEPELTELDAAASGWERRGWLPESGADEADELDDMYRSTLGPLGPMAGVPVHIVPIAAQCNKCGWNSKQHSVIGDRCLKRTHPGGTPCPGIMLPYQEPKKLDNGAVIKSFAGKARTMHADGEPCGLDGCLSHVTHPCDGCGRIQGRQPRMIVHDDHWEALNKSTQLKRAIWALGELAQDKDSNGMASPVEVARCINSKTKLHWSGPGCAKFFRVHFQAQARKSMSLVMRSPYFRRIFNKRGPVRKCRWLYHLTDLGREMLIQMGPLESEPVKFNGGRYFTAQNSSSVDIGKDDVVLELPPVTVPTTVQVRGALKKGTPDES